MKFQFQIPFNFHSIPYYAQVQLKFGLGSVQVPSLFLGNLFIMPIVSNQIQIFSIFWFDLIGQEISGVSLYVPLQKFYYYTKI